MSRQRRQSLAATMPACTTSGRSRAPRSRTTSLLNTRRYTKNMARAAATSPTATCSSGADGASPAAQNIAGA